MDALTDLIGDSPGIATVRDTVRRLLQRQSETRRLPPVLLEGETGTGKGLVARILHAAGPRAAGPFVDVNCAAIPETLLEAEMFGYERGAFTDARQAKAGLFQTADRGTIFLDEIGLLPEALQAKLLKVIEDRAVRRLGSTRSEPADVWIVAATSESLTASPGTRRFREDLYHRLAVVTIALPPLRERGADVLRLAEHFLARACADYGLAPKAFAPAARAALLAYAWPGNLRELANVMERVTLLSEGATVTADLLSLPAGPAARAAAAEGPGDGPSLRTAVRGVERDALAAALREAGGNISQAALRLGLSRNTLRYRLAKHGLQPGLPGPARPAPPVRAAAVPAAPPAPVPAAPVADVSGERRQLTLLQAVLVPPPAPAGDGGRLLDALADKVESFGGRVEERAGTLHAVFGIEPLEDGPLRAAHAAMAMQNAVERARRGGAAPLALVVAIHAGQFLVEPSAGAGELAPEARRDGARLLQALIDHAEPGSIVISGAAAAFLERRFELVPLGLTVEGAGSAARLAGRERSGGGPARRLAAFVGRRQDLELLQSRLASALGGRGQVVGIAGEAGIGKTRLLFELRQTLPAERVTYLEGHCVPYGAGIPYLPLLDLLRDTCGIVETDTPEAITEKVRIALEAVAMEPDEAAPYLLQLLGVKEGAGRLAALSPEAIKGRTFETLRQMALKASRQRPLVLAVENLHWIDRPSEEYLASVVESLAGAPILLLLTYRPGYRPPGMEKSYATQIALQPLAARESLSIVRAFAGAELPEAVAGAALAKAEGNPFFLEELGLALRDDPRDAPGVPAVPDTIQETLMARIDRLPDEPKRVLQTASVLGREFSLRLLGAIWPGPGGLDPDLVELKRLEFLYEQSGAEEPVYVFKHALTQEVAYESLPAARRRHLHAAAARTFEQLYAGRLAAVYERLAYHYARTDDSAKAVEYLTRAAEKAARSYAHAEALAALGEAVRHVDRLPAEARDRALVGLVLRQAHSLYFLGRFPESLTRLGGQRERVERLGDPALAGPYYFWLGHTESHLGDWQQAGRSARRALEEAVRGGDPATEGKAYYVLARGGFWSGRFAEGVEHGRKAIGLLERTDERWWLGAAHWGVAFNQGFMGEFAGALASAERARAVGDAIGDPRLRAYAAWTTGWLRAAMGDWDAGIAACRESLDHSPDPVNSADAMSFLGYAYVAKGDAERAVPLLTQAVEQWRLFQHRPMLSWFMALLGEAHLLGGDPGTARACVTEAAVLAAEAGFPYGLGVAQRAQGRLAARVGQPAEAEVQLRTALATFVAIEARHDVAWTRLDLAAVLHARGDLAAAGVELAEAHRAFDALRAPRHAAHAADLAARLGLPLPA